MHILFKKYAKKYAQNKLSNMQLYFNISRHYAEIFYY